MEEWRLNLGDQCELRDELRRCADALDEGCNIVGVAGEKATSLADFYRKVWARGHAGAVVPVDIEQNNAVRRVDITSMNRLDHLKLKSSLRCSSASWS